jgi:hypothetical protein
LNIESGCFFYWNRSYNVGVYEYKHMGKKTWLPHTWIVCNLQVATISAIGYLPLKLNTKIISRKYGRNWNVKIEILACCNFNFGGNDKLTKSCKVSLCIEVQS